MNISLLQKKRNWLLKMGQICLLTFLSIAALAAEVEPKIKESNNRLSIYINPIWQVQSNSQPAKTRSYVPDSVKIANLSIQGQFEYLLSRTRTLNGYKMVNPYRLSGFYQSVQDSLQKEKNKNQTQLNHLKSIQDSLKLINTELIKKTDILNNTQEASDQINFLGINFNKSSYHITVWGIIVALGLALFIVITRSAKNIIEAKHRTQLYEEITAEFQAFKSKANEKERKLARELQDERNLVEELKSKGY